MEMEVLTPDDAVAGPSTGQRLRVPNSNGGAPLLRASSSQNSLPSLYATDQGPYQQQHHAQQHHPHNRMPRSTTSQPNRASARTTKHQTTSHPIDHDFVVQAANPNHPDHQRWLETFSRPQPSRLNRRGEEGGNDDTRPSSASASLRPRAESNPARSVHGASKHHKPASSTQNGAPEMRASSSAQSGLRAPERGEDRLARSTGAVLAGSRQHRSSHQALSPSSSISSADEGSLLQAGLHTRERRRHRNLSDPHRASHDRPVSGSMSRGSSAAPSLDQDGAVHGTGRERRRRKKRDKSKARTQDRAPTPPMPPPRISSSINYQALNGLGSPDGLAAEAGNPPTSSQARQSAPPLPTLPQGVTLTTSPTRSAVSPTVRRKPAPPAISDALRSNHQPLYVDGDRTEIFESRSQAGGVSTNQAQTLDSVVPNSTVTSDTFDRSASGLSQRPSSPSSTKRLSSLQREGWATATESVYASPESRPTSSTHRSSIQPVHPEAVVRPGQRSIENRPKAVVGAANVASEQMPSRLLATPSEEPVVTTERPQPNRDTAEGRHRRSSSMDLIRGSLGLQTALASGEEHRRQKSDSRRPSASASSRIRASLDIARPRFLSQSEAKDEEGSQGSRSSSGRRLKSLFGALKPRSSESSDFTAFNNVSISDLPVSSDRQAESAATVPHYPSRGTQSMDVPRGLESRHYSREGIPPIPTLPSGYRGGIDTIEQADSSRRDNKARLSLVGEELEELTNDSFPKAAKQGNAFAAATKDAQRQSQSQRIGRVPPPQLKEEDVNAHHLQQAHTLATNKVSSGLTATESGVEHLQGATPIANLNNSQERPGNAVEFEGPSSSAPRVALAPFLPSSSETRHRETPSLTNNSHTESGDVSGSIGDEQEPAAVFGLGINDTTAASDERSQKSLTSRAWKARVPSFASLRSARRVKSTAQLKDSTDVAGTGADASNRPPPVPALGNAAMTPSFIAGVTNDVDDNASRQGSTRSESRQKYESQNGSHNVVPSSTRPKRSVLREVVAAGRKSFSRDRSQPVALASDRAGSQDPEVPTIHRSLGPALLSDLPAEDSASVDAHRDSHSVEAEQEPWDGMDDEAATGVGSLPALPPKSSRRPSAVNKAELNEIVEQESVSNGGVRSPVSRISDAAGSPGASGDVITTAVDPEGNHHLESLPRATSNQSMSALHQVQGSFSNHRASMGKLPPPDLHLSPAEEVLASPTEDHSASRKAGRFWGGRDGGTVSPMSEGNQWSLGSPSLRATRSSMGDMQRSPRSFSGSAASTPLGGSAAPSPSLGRPSFSQDPGRQAVASPYVQHVMPSDQRKKLKDTLRKMTPSSGRRGSEGGADSPYSSKGVSSEQFKSLEDRYALSVDPSDVSASSQYGFARDSDSQRTTSPVPPVLRDPWRLDDSLASAQAATQMLEDESNELQPSAGSTPMSSRLQLSPQTPNSTRFGGFSAPLQSPKLSAAVGGKGGSFSPAPLTWSSTSPMLRPTRSRQTSANSARQQQQQQAAQPANAQGQAFFSPPPPPAVHPPSAPSSKAPSTAAAADLNTLDLMVRQQQAREAQILHHISERNRMARSTTNAT